MISAEMQIIIGVMGSLGEKEDTVSPDQPVARWCHIGLIALGILLFAVTAMLLCYALEQRSTWFIIALPDRAPTDRCTASFKVHGRPAWSRQYGRW